MKWEMLAGVHPVCEALKAQKRKVHCVYVSKGRSGAVLETIVALSRERGVPVNTRDSSFFREMEPGHQNVAAKVSPLPTVEMEDILESAGGGSLSPFLLFLDNIEDPRNFGALVRSALCTGVHGVIIPQNRSAGLTPVVSKASAGAIEHMPIARVVNMVRAIKAAKKAGLWVFGADASGEKTLWDVDFTGPCAICIGSEGKGIRRLVSEECDALVSIPQQGPVGSLNASVAGTVILYEVVRQQGRHVNQSE